MIHDNSNLKSVKSSGHLYQIIWSPQSYNSKFTRFLLEMRLRYTPSNINNATMFIVTIKLPIGMLSCNFACSRSTYEQSSTFKYWIYMMQCYFLWSHSKIPNSQSVHFMYIYIYMYIYLTAQPYGKWNQTVNHCLIPRK